MPVTVMYQILEAILHHAMRQCHLAFLETNTPLILKVNPDDAASLSLLSLRMNGRSGAVKCLPEIIAWDMSGTTLLRLTHADP